MTGMSGVFHNPELEQIVAKWAQGFGDNFFMAARMEMDDDVQETGIVVINRVEAFPDHRSAVGAVAADFGPEEKMLWTRPNWTAVSDAKTWVISEVISASKKEIGVAMGPLEFEMDS